MYIIATTDPLSFVRWGSDGFDILDKNPSLSSFSWEHPACGHSGCRVYIFILSELKSEGNIIDLSEEITAEVAFSVLKAVIKSLPLCGPDFKTIIIKTKY